MGGCASPAPRCLLHATGMDTNNVFGSSAAHDCCSRQAASTVRNINGATLACNPSALTASEQQRMRLPLRLLQGCRHFPGVKRCATQTRHPAVLNRLGPTMKASTLGLAKTAKISLKGCREDTCRGHSSAACCFADRCPCEQAQPHAGKQMADRTLGAQDFRASQSAKQHD